MGVSGGSLAGLDRLGLLARDRAGTDGAISCFGAGCQMEQPLRLMCSRKALRLWTPVQLPNPGRTRPPVEFPNSEQIIDSRG